MNDYGGEISTTEKDIFSCQWNDIRKSVVDAMQNIQPGKESQVEEDKTGDKQVIDLGKMVSLVDVSGSMSGTPMEVAIALGLLVSEISSPAYAHRCLTFSSEPTWVELSEDMSLDEKVKKMQSAPWGMNTNFELAMEKILEVATTAKLNPEDIPNLIVFSDMQFDQARGYNSRTSPWETHHERIVRRFKEEGIKVCGHEWPAPHMIYWNLRGNTTGFPAQADTPGVTMLSGFSPALMKLLLSGESLEDDEEMVEIGEDGQEVKKLKNDPYTTVRKALDSEDYDKVREILNTSEENILGRYHWTTSDETKDVDHADEKKETESNEWEVV